MFFSRPKGDGGDDAPRTIFPGCPTPRHPHAQGWNIPFGHQIPHSDIYTVRFLFSAFLILVRASLQICRTCEIWITRFYIWRRASSSDALVRNMILRGGIFGGGMFTTPQTLPRRSNKPAVMVSIGDSCLVKRTLCRIIIYAFFYLAWACSEVSPLSKFILRVSNFGGGLKRKRPAKLFSS